MTTTTNTGATSAPAVQSTSATVDTTVANIDPKTLSQTDSKVDAKVQENPYKGSKHKVKLDGQEMDVDYDELVKGYQINKVALGKMQEAAKQRAQAEEVLKLFHTDPEQAAKILGVNAAEWANKFMEREAEMALKTPEERERMKLLDELKALKDEKTASEKAKEQEEFNRVFAVEATKLDEQFTSVLAAAGLPKTRGTVNRMAHYMLQFANAGHNVTPEDVVSYVQADYAQEHQELWGASDLDQLYKQLGEENVKKMIKMHNSKVSKTAEPKLSKADGTQSSQSPGKRKKPEKKFEDVFKELRGGRRF